MSDILIRGMEMPKRYEILCLFSDGSLGMLDTHSVFNPARPIDCAKAVALPEGHGRLIDADALDRAFTDLRFNSDGTLNHWGDRPGWCMHGYEVEKLIADAPTIVPTEGGTDECSEN